MSTKIDIAQAQRWFTAYDYTWQNLSQQVCCFSVQCS